MTDTNPRASAAEAGVVITEAMMQAGYKAYGQSQYMQPGDDRMPGWGESAERIYRAMLAAAPVSPSPAGVGVWQPIETAPRDGTRVLLWFDCWPYDAAQIGYCRMEEFGGQVIDFWRDASDGEQFEAANDQIVWPTHWMPLPPAPEALLGSEVGK